MSDPYLCIPLPIPATQSEVDAGTVNSKYVTPGTLAGNVGPLLDDKLDVDGNGSNLTNVNAATLATYTPTTLPVSTAAQTALDLKANAASPSLTGTVSLSGRIKQGSYDPFPTENMLSIAGTDNVLNFQNTTTDHFSAMYGMSSSGATKGGMAFGYANPGSSGPWGPDGCFIESFWAEGTGSNYRPFNFVMTNNDTGPKRFMGIDGVNMTLYQGMGLSLNSTSGTITFDNAVLGSTNYLTISAPMAVWANGNVDHDNVALVTESLNSATTAGISLGYDTVTGNGAIQAQGNGAGLDFWFYNGDWNKRFSISNSGLASFLSNGVNDHDSVMLISQVVNTATTKGLSLGYDSSSNEGIIQAQGDGNGLAWWTYSGGTWYKRMSLSNAGTLTATAFSGPLTGNVTGNITGTAPAGTLTGTTLASNVVTATIGTLTGLTSNGFVKTSGGTGALSVDTTTYLSALPTSYTAVAAGTAYTLTGSFADVDFGTTDPAITISNAGNYLLTVDCSSSLNAATTVSGQSVEIILRRTNNTAADIGTTRYQPLPASTLGTSDGPSVSITSFPYTASAGDVVTVQARITGTLGAGSVTISNAHIVAVPR